MEKETGECNIKRIGTREEVFRGHAIRTAGGLKRDDIISKQLGTKIIYISKKLSAKMKENFNIIRASNPNYFKKQIKKTMVKPSNLASSSNNNTINISNSSETNKSSINSNTNKQINKPATKTLKLAFKIDENIEKNIYYKELQGMNISELKEELKREEAEEDFGVPKKEFSIEEMPDITLDNLI